MEREDPPKKILMIKDCTFILPDDFNGSVEDAFELFLKYRDEHLDDAHYINDADIFSTFDVLLHSGKDTRVCGQYAIYEFVNGRYKLSKIQRNK